MNKLWVACLVNFKMFCIIMLRPIVFPALLQNLQILEELLIPSD
jgi:hypothetical protein